MERTAGMLDQFRIPLGPGCHKILFTYISKSSSKLLKASTKGGKNNNNNNTNNNNIKGADLNCQNKTGWVVFVQPF
jgi:hypothetical protein